MSATGISLMHAGPNREEVLRHGSTTARGGAARARRSSAALSWLLR
jgi:hypothetical protein